MEVKLKQQKLFIKAPRELVFQVLAAVGKGKLPGAAGESVRVLHQEEDTIIAQFTTRAGRRIVNTVEEVKLYPPERVTFRHLAGPLDCAWEEMVLKEKDDGTELVYWGEFAYQFTFLGWLISRLYIRPLHNRAVREHLRRIKVAAEQRAQRSHIFRQGDKTAAA